MHSISLKFKNGDGNVAGNAGTVSDLTGWDCPCVPAEMFHGQVPICLRSYFFRWAGPLYPQGTSLLSISANVKSMLTES